MKKILFVILFIIILLRISSSQTINIPVDDFQKLEVYKYKYQHSNNFSFFQWKGDCFGCWIRSEFERITFDTSNSYLTIKGKLICENWKKTDMPPNDFKFILGDLKTDTANSKLYLENILEILPYEIYNFYDTNKFEIKIKIYNDKNILCLTLSQDSFVKREESNYLFPTDPVTFYEVGKLLRQNK